MYGAVGIQLSARCTGLCFVPPEWDRTCASLVFESVESERDAPAYGKVQVLARLEAERYLRIADKVVKFVKKFKTRAVVAERYGYSQDGVTPYLIANAELGGVVKSQLLLACKASVAPFAVSTMRSFLLGGMKQGEDQKKQVENFMKKRGFRFENWAEMGAFVAAYYWFCTVNESQNRFLPQQPLF